MCGSRIGLDSHGIDELLHLDCEVDIFYYCRVIAISLLATRNIICFSNLFPTFMF